MFKPTDSQIRKAAKKATSIRDLARRLDYLDHPGSHTCRRFENVLGLEKYNELADGRKRK